VSADGTPSLVRLGGIVEAIARLMRDNKQVILVSSGAVGCGRSKLRKQVRRRASPARRDPEFRRRRCTGRCATT
jgi:delta-1-pyrroline-5-carboxylate synthetase